MASLPFADESQKVDLSFSSNLIQIKNFCTIKAGRTVGSTQLITKYAVNIALLCTPSLTWVLNFTRFAAPFHLSVVTNVFRKMFFLCMRNETWRWTFVPLSSWFTAVKCANGLILFLAAWSNLAGSGWRPLNSYIYVQFSIPIQCASSNERWEGRECKNTQHFFILVQSICKFYQNSVSIYIVSS